MGVCCAPAGDRELLASMVDPDWKPEPEPVTVGYSDDPLSTGARRGWFAFKHGHRPERVRDPRDASVTVNENAPVVENVDGSMRRIAGDWEKTGGHVVLGDGAVLPGGLYDGVPAPRRKPEPSGPVIPAWEGTAGDAIAKMRTLDGGPLRYDPERRQVVTAYGVGAPGD